MTQVLEAEAQDAKLELENLKARDRKKTMLLESFFERIEEEVACDLGGDRVNGD